MDSLKKEKQSVWKPREASIGKPILERISRMKELLQGFRVLLDEDLQPLGITTSQLRMLWSIAGNPGISGAKVARLCSVTPQSGQATMVAELTSKGQRVLVKARKIAEALDHRLWNGIGERDLAGLDAALRGAVEKLTLK
jgi:DNA-binding MarR family transcriptional regulator